MGGSKAQPTRAPRNDPATIASENRKLRNRLSQKAYRARQCMRIKELEDRLESRPLSENNRVFDLEEQNIRLRDQLLSCHKKLESLQITMKALADSAADALGMEPGAGKPACHNEKDENNTDETGSNEDSVSVYAQPGTERQHRHDVENSTLNDHFAAISDIDENDLPLGTEFLNSEDPVELQQMLHLPSEGPPDIFELNNFLNVSGSQGNELTVSTRSTMFPSPSSQLPLNFSFAHMGPAAYVDVLAKGPLLVHGANGQLRRTNSLFSDHICVVEHFLRQKWLNQGALVSPECLASSVSFMLSVFVCMSWSQMAAWHTWTRAHVPLKNLILWHLSPTQDLYSKIAACYRPTHLQLSVPHPAVIDWIPWPEMRDKLILCHSANPRLDDIICEIGNSYVCEGDLSRIIANIRPVMGYVGVWDLVRAISPEATSAGLSEPTRDQIWSGNFDADFSSDADSPQDSLEDSDGAPDITCSLPAPNVAALFASKTLALQAFRFLGCDRGAVTFKLSPELFERHPELYDCRASLMARGIPLRPPSQTSIIIPRPLDSSILGRYRELTTWTFELSFEGLPQSAGECMG